MSDTLRETEAIVNVEEGWDEKRSLTQAIIHVEERWENKLQLTQALIMVEYVVDLRRKGSVAAQMF